MPTSGSISNSAFVHVEDVPHVTGDSGAFVLGVRNDAAAALTTTNGDYSPFATDSAGRIGITDLGGTITVDGTVAVTQSTSPWVIGDGGSSITVDGTVAATQSGAWSVTVLNGAGAAAVNIQDGGNSITVDGAVTVSGTVTADTELPAASALADNDPNPTTSRIGANNLVWDGANWDRWTGAITDGGGSITVDGTVAATQSGAWAVSVNNAAGASAVNIQDGGNSITVDGTVAISGTVTTGDNKNEDDAHSSGATGSFSLAVRNNAGTPLAADGDYIPFTTDTNGDLYVTTGRNGTLANGAETAVTNVAAQILAANTARKKYIVQNTGANNIRVGVTGVTATTGFRLVAGGSMIVEMPNCPTNAIFAIREGASNSTAFTQEIT